MNALFRDSGGHSPTSATAQATGANIVIDLDDTIRTAWTGIYRRHGDLRRRILEREKDWAARSVENDAPAGAGCVTTALAGSCSSALAFPIAGIAGRAASTLCQRRRARRRHRRPRCPSGSNLGTPDGNEIIPAGPHDPRCVDDVVRQPVVRRRWDLLGEDGVRWRRGGPGGDGVRPGRPNMQCAAVRRPRSSQPAFDSSPLADLQVQRWTARSMGHLGARRHVLDRPWRSACRCAVPGRRAHTGPTTPAARGSRMDRRAGAVLPWEPSRRSADPRQPLQDWHAYFISGDHRCGPGPGSRRPLPRCAAGSPCTWPRIEHTRHAEPRDRSPSTGGSC